MDGIGVLCIMEGGIATGGFEQAGLLQQVLHEAFVVLARPDVSIDAQTSTLPIVQKPKSATQAHFLKNTGLDTSSDP